MEQIYYKDGYKYQLVKTYTTQINIYPDKNIDTEFIKLTTMGKLTICKYYCWDGPSGPTWDTKSFMRGSLVHDALYQLIRQGYLDLEQHRELSDKELYRICREDGMSWIRAQWVYRGVRIGGKGAASSENIKKILVAP